jgi:hypothetical protein
MKIGNLSVLDGWFEFKAELTKYYPNFFDSLHRAFPKLKPGEKKICALLFLDCSTKEIAKKLDKEPHSIDAARSRLRKTFKLGEEDSLSTYLQNLK